MPEDPVCPKCGGVMPGDAPQGLCPTCRVALALGVQSLSPSSNAPGDPDRSTVHEDETLFPKIADPHDIPTIGPVAASDAPTEPVLEAIRSLGAIRYFGDYELLSEIARGGMGVVYRARQVSLNRPVALKMILSGNLAGEEDIKRFHIEAEAAANLDHPGIVPIYEIGEHDGQHFFSMGFVAGTSLAAKVAAGPLPPREAATLTMQVAEAMQYAHERNVIHRDLKPANVLLDRQGQPRVTDFGLAKRLQADSGLTQTGQVMGTPSYMPPEQAEGNLVGPAADVYALGAILYCLLTGRPPFQAASPMETLIQVVGQEPVPVRQLNPSVPRDLETICLKCLAKEPERRCASAAALAQELGRFLAGKPILARPVGTTERLWRWCRRNPVMAGLSGAAAVSLIAGTVVSTLFGIRANRDAITARERLWGSLVAQGRAERLSGCRWSALEAISEAAKIRRTDDLRQLAIEAIAAPGVRLERVIPFGDAQVVRFSTDGSLLAIHGFHFGDPGDGGTQRRRIVVYQVSDGREVDRIEETNDGPSGLVAFRPNSTILAYWDYRISPSTLAFRDVVRHQDVASLPGVQPMDIFFSPDGAKLALWKDGSLHTFDASSLREERSRQSVNGPYGFLTNSELLIEEAGSLKTWDVSSGLDSCTFAIPQGKAFHFQRSCGSVAVLVDRTPAQTVSLWDIRTGKELARLDDAVVGQWGFGLRVTAPSSLLAFSVRSRPGEILLYDAVRRMPRSRIFGVVEAQGNFNFEQLSSLSPDGRLLAAYARVDGGAGPNTIQIWDVETGQKVASLGNCIKPLWSPDARHLVAVAPGKLADLVGLDIVAGGSSAWSKSGRSLTSRQPTARTSPSRRFHLRRMVTGWPS